jgi:predicted RNA binding protein YcfA (HicA-like mRNA interferase family)
MSVLPSVNAKRVLVALQSIGWHVKRQAGSHRTLAHDGCPDFVFAFHDGEKIGPRMLSRIAKNTGLQPIGRIKKREFVCHPPATHPRKILFDHLPKCGGSTLTAYLEEHYPRASIYSIDGLNPVESVMQFKGLHRQDRYGYSLIAGHLANELIDFADPACLKVTILRDPVERIVSHYFYARNDSRHYLHSIIHSSKMSLDCYVGSDISDELRNWYTTHFSGLPLDVAEQKPEESIEKAAKVLLKHYDVVGFLDNFSLFIDSLRRQANLACEYDGNRVNVGERRPCVESVPQSSIERIKQVNFLDIALYERVSEVVG